MADIKVNEADWTELPAADRKKINEIMSAAFREPHNIVPSSASPKALAASTAPDLKAAAASPICSAACSAAEAVAVAACGSLPPPANAICIAAAHAAGEFCRSKC